MAAVFVPDTDGRVGLTLRSARDPETQRLQRADPEEGDGRGQMSTEIASAFDRG